MKDRDWIWLVMGTEAWLKSQQKDGEMTRVAWMEILCQDTDDGLLVGFDLQKYLCEKNLIGTFIAIFYSFTLDTLK